MFNKILIANRGEIACRIIKTAKRLGIATVAVYSTADQHSLHVSQADEAYCIGGAPARESYLNIDAILEAANASHAEAIHPGYGFLSENPAFATACLDAGIVFIGPGVEALKAMGSKQTAKQLLEKTSVPLTPGYHGASQSVEELLAQARKIGFPVLLKAAAGGGGKGMRAVYEESEFEQAYKGAAREAKACFADETMLIEKLMLNPRHIEIQLMADHHGNVVHLFERDCSLQRRHQKIIEEAPAPHLSDALRCKLGQAAIEVAHAIQYRGAGTVEFLLDQQQQFYFMEMNTRLQVEHPVTEMITGFDLVEWQLKIATGEPLPLQQEQIKIQGHAIECRIYAEDPAQDFMPSTGPIRFLKAPQNTGIRIDTGIQKGSFISMHYDPMIAKLIAWGDNRNQALQRLEKALANYNIGGVKTNIPFLQSIIQHPTFIQAEIHTDFLKEESITLPEIDDDRFILMAAAADYLRTVYPKKTMLDQDTFAWQMHLKSQWRSTYCSETHCKDVLILPDTLHRMALVLDGKTVHYEAQMHENRLSIQDGNQTWHIFFECLADGFVFYHHANPVKIIRQTPQQKELTHAGTRGKLTAPMPATVVAVFKHKGETIKAGERLMILEAMKMEHTILAPEDGLLLDIYYDVGSQVSEGVELASVDSLKA